MSYSEKDLDLMYTDFALHKGYKTEIIGEHFRVVGIIITTEEDYVIINCIYGCGNNNNNYANRIKIEFKDIISYRITKKSCSGIV